MDKPKNKLDMLLHNTKKLNDFSKKLNPFSELENRINEAFLYYSEQEKELKEYPLYNEIIEELEQKSNELIEVKKELENLKSGFRKFYEKSQPKYNEEIKNVGYINYSLDCDYSEFKIKNILYPIFKMLFDCTETEIINFLSENITVQLIVKDEVLIKDIVYLLDSLSLKKIIKSKQVSNIIVKSQSIIYNGLPLNSNQIKNARKTLKTSFPSEYLKINLD